MQCKNDMEIVLFGAGNVATHLGKALKEAGHAILQVWSRTKESAEALASSLGCDANTFGNPISLTTSHQGPIICIISVKDDAIAELAAQYIPQLPNAIWTHTAGSVSIEVLNIGVNPLYGVLYPMQTFSKNKAVDFRAISIFVEANGCEKELTDLANSLTETVYPLDGEGRRRLHLAAVFACNFVNHCYAISERILSDAGLPFEVMLPLIEETADKVHHLSPRLAQTGPASRHDQQILDRQRAMLEDDPLTQDIYDKLSESIIHLGKLR